MEEGKSPQPTLSPLPSYASYCKPLAVFWQSWLSGLSRFKAFSALWRRRVSEISGLQQNSALQEPQLDLTWRSTSTVTECRMRYTVWIWVYRRTLKSMFLNVHAWNYSVYAFYTNANINQYYLWLELQSGGKKAQTSVFMKLPWRHLFIQTTPHRSMDSLIKTEVKRAYWTLYFKRFFFYALKKDAFFFLYVVFFVV